MIVSYSDITGGMNDTVSPDSLKDNEARYIENFVIAKDGGVVVRAGTKMINEDSFAGEIDQVIEWVLSDGSVILLNMIDKKLYELVKNADTGKIGKTLKIELAKETISYAPYKNVFYFLDGSEYYSWGDFDYYSSNGTVTIKKDDIVKNEPKSTHSSAPGEEGHFYKALSAHGEIDLKTADYGNEEKWEDVTHSSGLFPDIIRAVVPTDDETNDLTPIRRCKYIIQHPYSLRFFFAGDSKDQFALYYSEVDNPKFVKATNKLYPTTASGPITGLVSIMRHICVSYYNQWRAWSGAFVGGDAQWKRLPIPEGCINSDTIALTPESMTFMGQNGIHIVHVSLIYDDVVVVSTESMFKDIIANKMENTFAGIVHPETCRGVYHKNKYYLAYGDDPTNPKNNKIMVFDWLLGFSPVIFSGLQVNSWCSRQDGSLIFGSKNYNFQMGVGTHDYDVSTGKAKPIKAELLTQPYKLLPPSYAFHRKQINIFFIQSQQQKEKTENLDITVITDYTEKKLEADLAEALVYGRPWRKIWGWSDIVTQEAVVENVGTRVAVKLESTDIDNPVHIYRFGFDFDVIPPRATEMEQDSLVDENNWL